MVIRVQISSNTIMAAMQTQTVRRALKVKADKKQAAAEQIALSEGVSLDSSVVEGTRPQGRPYARVQTKNVAQEWGARGVVRRRILGRAARS